jgi:hypothetical protein
MTIPDDVRQTIEAALNMARPHVAVAGFFGNSSGIAKLDAALTWLSQPQPEPLDAMDRLLNNLMSVYGDAIEDMPDAVADDYLTVRAWVDAQPVGWTQPATVAGQWPRICKINARTSRRNQGDTYGSPTQTA